MSGLREAADDLLARAGLVGAKATAVKAAAVLTAVGIAFALAGTRHAAPVEFESDPVNAAGPAQDEPGENVTECVVVHVAGAVLDPGVYELAAGSRVDDAVRSAGGVLGNGALDALNLARVLCDGEQIYVPTTDEVAGGMVSAAGQPTGGASSGLVNLNTASAAELDALPGIGPSTAQKIVDDRTSNGPFVTVDDLARVSGIGDAKVESLRDLVTVG